MLAMYQLIDTSFLRDKKYLHLTFNLSICLQVNEQTIPIIFQTNQKQTLNASVGKVILQST